MDRIVRDLDGNGLQEGQIVSTILGPGTISTFVHYPSFSAIRVDYEGGCWESLSGGDVRLHGDHPLAPEGI